MFLLFLSIQLLGPVDTEVTAKTPTGSSINVILAHLPYAHKVSVVTLIFPTHRRAEDGKIPTNGSE